MLGKTLFLLITLAGCYVLILSNEVEGIYLVGLWLLLGFLKALVGINIGHDAIHGAYSSSNRMNQWLGATFDLLGVSAYSWRFTHNIIHHTYTNIPEYDFDISVAGNLLRFSPTGKHQWYMRWQHYYAFVLYGISPIFRAIKQEYIKFFSTKLANYPLPKPPLLAYIKFFFYRFMYWFLFLLLPIYCLSMIWWKVVLLFILSSFVEGLCLALTFQLAHVVEKTAYPKPDEQGQMANHWAIHQMHTTANFAPKQVLFNGLGGGLNRQIEHHLFPKICHIHYPNIAPIVKQTAKEFNLPYHEYPTFRSAVYSHYQMLKKLGKGGTL